MMDQLAQTVAVARPFLDRARDVGCRRHLVLREFTSGPVVRLAHDVGDTARVDAELVAIFGNAQGFLHSRATPLASIGLSPCASTTAAEARDRSVSVLRVSVSRSPPAP